MTVDIKMPRDSKAGSAERYFLDGKYFTAEEVRKMFAGEQLSDRSEICLDLIDGDVVVDIGCYAGLFVKRAARRYPDKTVIGVDYDEESLKVAHMLHPERREDFRKMSVYSLDFDDRSVDCVTFQEVIEHLEGAGQAVKEINRILKPGGSFIVSIPNVYYWKDIFSFARTEIHSAIRRRLGKETELATIIFFGNVEWNRHIFSWSPSTLMTLLRVNGFRYDTHCFSRGEGGPFARLTQMMFPFFGPCFVLKVRKEAAAPQRLI